MAELCSHQVNAANWFLGSSPDAVIASGGLYRFPENREVYDHVYVTFEYPGGRTADFSSIESNAFDDYYEMYLGTKGTLIWQLTQYMRAQSGVMKTRPAFVVNLDGAVMFDVQVCIRATPPTAGSICRTRNCFPATHRRRRRRPARGAAGQSRRR
jgi:predicted dehydrogenase